MKKTSEAVKDGAVLVGQLFNNSFYWRESIEIQLLHDKKFFLESCAVFFNNRKDIAKICFAMHNGIKYLMDGGPDKVVELYQAINSPAVSNELRMDILAELSEAAKPKPKTVNPPVVKKMTKVYLIQNTRNGYYKIGRSNNPPLRESTLQSEEPELVLLGHWSAPTNMEIELHQKFSDKRVRGEWFRLEQIDVEEIKNVLEMEAV